MRQYCAAAAGALLCAIMGNPAAAQAQASTMVSAGDPDGMVAILDLAGYNPTLKKDSGGDPQIVADIAGYDVNLYFYGCNQKTHDGCDAIQFQIGFDRKDPWPAKDAAAVARNWRFASVWLDDEGDPYVAWDLVTGDGIPAKVFLKSVRSFGDSVDEVAKLVFPEDGSQDTE